MKIFILIFLGILGIQCKEFVEELNCVPVSECKIYLKLIKEKTLTHEMIAILRDAHCGWSATQEKVWCPVFIESEEPEIPGEDQTVVSKEVIDRLGTRASLSKGHLLPSLEECGKHVEGRVFGGKATDIDEFPWSVMLLYQKPNSNRMVPRCGGVLISKRYVVTAAHCIHADLKTVVLGEYDTRNETDCIHHFEGNDECAPEPIRLGVEEAVQHPDYKPLYWNDIGLLRLEEDVVFTDFVAPICLPMDMMQTLIVGTNLTATGWGAYGTARQEATSPIKLKVNLPVVSKAVCSRRQRLNITEGMICAGGNKNEDTCHGDSGGPLMFYDSKTLLWHLVGIVNFSKWPCGFVGVPAVYAWVPAYMEWIYETIHV